MPDDVESLLDVGYDPDEPASILMLFAPGAPREHYFEGFGHLGDMTDDERRVLFAEVRRLINQAAPTDGREQIYAEPQAEVIAEAEAAARDVLAQVIDIYPRTNAARLAAQRLEELGKGSP